MKGEVWSCLDSGGGAMNEGCVERRKKGEEKEKVHVASGSLVVVVVGWGGLGCGSKRERGTLGIGVRQ